MSQPNHKLQGVLTFDVEDWHHANFSQLRGHEQRIEKSVQNLRYAMDANVELWIHTLKDFEAKSTCFILGEFAQRFPHVIRNLAQAGHEIASHGEKHELIYHMSRNQFRECLKRSLGILGNLTGQSPKGFRAPSWSVNDQVPWFCEELEAQNIVYDSSVFPIRTPLFGSDSSPISPYWEGKVLRLPVTLFTLGSFRIPIGSGAFFRLMPYRLTQYGLKRAAIHRQSAMVILHPRELDPQHPRLPLRGWEHWIHYFNLKSTSPKLTKLLKNFRWTSIDEAYRDQLKNPGWAP